MRKVRRAWRDTRAEGRRRDAKTQRRGAGDKRLAYYGRAECRGRGEWSTYVDASGARSGVAERVVIVIVINCYWGLKVQGSDKDIYNVY